MDPLKRIAVRSGAQHASSPLQAPHRGGLCLVLAFTLFACSDQVTFEVGAASAAASGTGGALSATSAGGMTGSGAGGVGGGGVGGVSGAGGMWAVGGAGGTGGTGGVGAWTPESIPGLVLWLDGSEGVGTTAGAVVTQWFDQSGQNNHAAPPVDPSSAPIWEPNAMGGKPGVRFDGTNDYIIVNDSVSLQFATGDFVLAVAARHTTVPAGPWGYGFFYTKQEATYPFVGPALVGNTEPGTTHVLAQLSYHGADATTAQSGLNNGAPMVLLMHRTVVGNTATLDIRLNGAGSGSETGSNFALNISAAGYPAYLGGTPNIQALQGDIAEVIAVKGITAAKDIAAIEAYLMTKYGI